MERLGISRYLSSFLAVFLIGTIFFALPAYAGDAVQRQVGCQKAPALELRSGQMHVSAVERLCAEICKLAKLELNRPQAGAVAPIACLAQTALWEQDRTGWDGPTADGGDYGSHRRTTSVEITDRERK